LLEKLEAQLASMADEKLRSATNAATLALADELVEAGAAYDASTAVLSEVSTRALAVTMEANGLAVFAASSRIEVAAATMVVAEALRQHGRAVLNGLAKAEMPKPESVKPVEVSKNPTVTAASPPVQFHRVDRPSYQMRFRTGGSS
jgi:2'-5' RNA ligase